jgi:hypothetical protein
MNALVLVVLGAAGAFPLPSLDGKPLATSAKQTSFRLPLRFDRVRAFYEAQFPEADRAQVQLTLGGTGGKRTLTLVSRRADDTWRKAVVREGEIDTVIEVTPLIRLDETAIEGNGKPLVQFVIGRSADVKRAVDAIDDKHTEQLRK